MRRRDAAWSVALEDNCVRGAVMCCSLLYPVLAVRGLGLGLGVGVGLGFRLGSLLYPVLAARLRAL